MPIVNNAAVLKNPPIRLPNIPNPIPHIYVPNLPNIYDPWNTRHKKPTYIDNNNPLFNPIFNAATENKTETELPIKENP